MTLIFLYIPKTAGTSLLSLIRKQYPESEVFHADGVNVAEHKHLRSLSATELKRLRVVIGHLNFGIHRLFTQKCSYITFLRNPVDRIVSHYSYIKNAPLHDDHDYLVNNNVDLLGFSNGSHFPRLTILQTRQISGCSGPDTGKDGELMLEAAKTNLRSSFLAFGLMERFEESVELISRKLGWSASGTAMENVSGNRPKLDEMDPLMLDKVEARNSLDIELYKWCSDRFRNQTKIAMGGISSFSKQG